MFQVFFWIFGVITCAFYTLVLMVHSQHVLVFCPLAFIAIANAYVLIMLRKAPSMSANQLLFLANSNRLAITAATALVIVLSPLCVLATLGLVFSIVQLGGLPHAIAAHQPLDQFYGPAIFCGYYLYVAIGPVVTAGFINIKLDASNPHVKTLETISYPTCIAIFLAVVLIGIFPYSLTQTCVVASQSPKNLAKSLLLMRAAGNEPALLSNCYGEGMLLPWQLLVSHNWSEETESTSVSRELYYRVYGRSFNTRKHPVWQSLISFDFFEIFNLLTEDTADSFDYYFQRDSDFAGEHVGGIIHGLDLSSSKVNGTINPDECVANLNWTMKFHNTYKGEKELRAQILLPPHAVISGCSLMIDGKRHDAIFATRASSRQAYVEAAESGSTPLLISTAGAGRVLLQSSSGYSNKDVELSLQMTSPLTLLTSQKVALPLPLVTERNFAIKCKHEVSIVSSSGEAQKLDFQNDDLVDGKSALFWKRNSDKKVFYAQDPSQQDNRIVETIVSQKNAPDQPLIVVVDGSDKMTGSIDKVADQLEKLKSKKASIVWASDKPLVVIANADSNSEAWREAVARLRDSACVGGQDNAAALTLALLTGGLTEDSNVIWLHGPQPVAFTGDKLLPLLKSSKHSVKLFEYQMVPGPNEVIKSMDQTPALHQVPDLEGPAKDLSRLFAAVSGQEEYFSIERKSAPDVVTGAILSSNGKSLLQLYYADVILTDKKDLASVRKLGAVAEKLGIVTPVTSALVLDWKTQYRDIKVEQFSKPQIASKGGNASSKMPFAGLASNMSIPVKPEPPLPVTIACAILMMSGVLWIKRRKNQSPSTS